ncbi:MAG: Gfo/Idh/MocA family oxidoreductase [Gammaproteobacteria bacterium]|nr:Gfo/Idh/MocA family oxidoreductase [Gammaproteobacteria bacterium]
MTSIKIIGAGSIGNHLAHAARVKGWGVLLTDMDHEALRRTKEEIYPQRYSEWDAEIQLANSKDTVTETADVVFIGTPPDSHLALAQEVLDNAPPRVLIIEKPLCGPDLVGCAEIWEKAEESGVFLGVGYNHALGANTRAMDELIAEEPRGMPQTLSAKTREHWGGIFKAHPWLSGPEDSYLGFSSRGGGACGEHSHAINIWQHFAHTLGAGKVQEVTAVLDMRRDGNAYYDQLAILGLRTEQGLVGEVIQDVVTAPTEKMARIQWSKSFAEWHVNYKSGADAVIRGEGSGTPQIALFEKTRADDFILEIEHLEQVLKGTITDSPISLQRGLDTMMVIAAAFRSAKEKRNININWSAGYRLEALQ